MTLQQCRYLVEISKYGSITKAAEKLFVTQPSISKAINDLEDDLGISILTRTSHGVTFTKDGTELLSYARILTEQEDNIRYHFTSIRRKKVTVLNISSQHFGFAANAVSKTAAEFGSVDFEITFLEGKASDVIHNVSSDISSVGVLSCSASGTDTLARSLSELSLEFTKLADIREHVFLSKDHPLSSKKEISLEELRDYPFLTYRREDTHQIFSEDFLDADSSPQVIYVQDRGTMDDLLLHTCGYNIGTGCLTSGFIQPEIKAIPLSGDIRMEIGYITKIDRNHDAAADIFLKYLRESISSSIPPAL
jgi:DNA-binding transcriptional LysR family regulator